MICASIFHFNPKFGGWSLILRGFRMISVVVCFVHLTKWWKV